MASTSIPILFVHTKIGKYYYVDGGVSNNLPALCLVKEGRMLIGLNSNHTEEMDKEFTSMLAVGERCMRIEVHSKVMEQARFCDKLVGPNELHRYGTFDFDEADEIFAIGYKTGTEQVREIINKLEI